MRLDFKNVDLVDVSFKGIEQFLKDYDNYLGWYHFEKIANLDLINRLRAKSEFIVKNCDVFLIVGIGGSFSGTKAILESLNPYFSDKKPEIYFVGNSLSSDYLFALKEKIKDKSIMINYVSKSGKTLESRLVFNDLMLMMHEKYETDEIEKRVIYTTSDEKIVPKNFDWFKIEDDIGGRFSVFSPVGLLAFFVNGIDVEKLLEGVERANANLDLAKQIARFRYSMIKAGKEIEAYVVYEPKLFSLLEWIKQLIAESLGKDGQGLFPVGLVNTTDLHSFGQYLQEGKRNVFEFVIKVDSEEKIFINELNKNLDEINEVALEATMKAHHQGGVPNGLIDLGKLDEMSLGMFMQMMMLSCVFSGFLEKVNPFDQEGVEVYKEEMRLTIG